MDRANAALAAYLLEAGRPGASRRPRHRSALREHDPLATTHVVPRPRGLPGARRTPARARRAAVARAVVAARSARAGGRQRRQLRLARHQLGARRARGLAGPGRRRAVVEPLPESAPEGSGASRASASRCGRPVSSSPTPRPRVARADRAGRRRAGTRAHRLSRLRSRAGVPPTPRNAPRRAPHCSCRGSCRSCCSSARSATTSTRVSTCCGGAGTICRVRAVGRALVVAGGGWRVAGWQAEAERGTAAGTGPVPRLHAAHPRGARGRRSAGQPGAL